MSNPDPGTDAATAPHDLIRHLQNQIAELTTTVAHQQTAIETLNGRIDALESEWTGVAR